MIEITTGKPGEGMSYESLALHAPTARRKLRLLCVLVPSRSGGIRSLPVHTLRPMPPRVSGQGKWHLASDTGFYLREAHATTPAPEVLARYLRLGQTNALRADSGTVRVGGLSHV